MCLIVCTVPYLSYTNAVYLRHTYCVEVHAHKSSVPNNPALKVCLQHLLAHSKRESENMSRNTIVWYLSTHLSALLNVKYVIVKPCT